ncbi:Protein-lysine N-methyltransferase rrg1 [Emydomyces testavorans]|uniref:Protein-lysine N-methyltransferase rrg1 n=1 Tax=Emydomyces testavorans TaxID=2070801 RepID=A0AAF0IF80_9EURO|nr:Protein-lysine N-methyltransferase rrg1 [Emydomyces testavorans]
MADDIQRLHVLDLPQLYTKPAAAEILRALDLLAIQPRTFNRSEDLTQDSQPIDPSGIAQYLTGIISSALSWVDCDELRETIWDAASTRLCERSGRAAIPSITRVFNVPVTESVEVPITLREPSLTSDNLGMKTWVSSYLLARRLSTLLLPPSKLFPSMFKGSQLFHVLELGAGTGLAGISFASLLGSAASVHLTDLPDIAQNLAHNVSLNGELLLKTGASITTGVLDWSVQGETATEGDERYDIILAADPLYSPEHPRWLTQTIQRWLSPDSGSRVILEMPLRDAYLSQVNELKKRLHNIGLTILEDGEESGHDDWENRDGSPLEVRCWWSVWTWDTDRLSQN